MAVLAAALLACQPVLDNGFSRWDEDLLFEAGGGLPRGSLPNTVHESFVPVRGRAYYPIYRLSIALDVQVWGEGAFGHHLHSLILHALVSLLVYWLGLRLFRGIRLPPDSTTLIAGLAAVLFAVHPVNVEPVAWICGRKVQLAVLFSLLAFHCYLSESRQGWWHVPALLCFALGCLSNAAVAGLPFFMVVHEVLVRKRSPGVATLKRAGFIAVMVVSAWARLDRVALEQSTGEEGHSLVEWIPTVSRALFDHLGTVVWPAKLSNFYPLPSVAFADPRALLGLGVFGSLLVSLWRLRRHRLLPFLLAWFLFGLAPAAAHHVTHADRHLYLPLVGLCWLASLGIVALGRVTQRFALRVLVGICSTAMVVGLVIRARDQCRVWRDPVSLWTNALAVSPEFWLAHEMLGTALAEVGDSAEAIRCYRRALQLKPDSTGTRYDLAEELSALGQTDAAIAELGIVLQLEPTSALAHVKLGQLLTLRSKAALAEDHFRRALRADPNMVEAYGSLATLLEERQAYAEAVAVLQEALARRPSDPRVLSHLGSLLAACPDRSVRDPAAGIGLALAACRETDFADLSLVLQLADAYAEAGESERAIGIAGAARQQALTDGEGEMVAVAEERIRTYRSWSHGGGER